MAELSHDELDLVIMRTCGGQNKNATMVQYLLFRVMTGLHDEVTLSFMITGHTKFSPLACGRRSTGDHRGAGFQILLMS